MNYCEKILGMIRKYEAKPGSLRRVRLNLFLNALFGGDTSYDYKRWDFRVFYLDYYHHDYLNRRQKITVAVFPESRRVIAVPASYQKLATNKFAKLFEEMP